MRMGTHTETGRLRRSPTIHARLLGHETRWEIGHGGQNATTVVRPTLRSEIGRQQLTTGATVCLQLQRLKAPRCAEARRAVKMLGREVSI